MNGMKVKEVALKWGISEDKVRELCRSGKIPGAEKTSAGWCIPFDAVNPCASNSDAESNNISRRDNAANEGNDTISADNEAESEDNPDLIKQFFIRLLCFILCLGVIALGLCVMLGVKKIFFGLIITVVGVLITVWGAQAIDETSKKLKARLKTDKQLKKKVVIIVASIAAAAILIPAFIITVNTSKDVFGRNMAAQELLSAPIDEDVYYRIEEYEKKCQNYNGLSRLFFGYKDEVKALKSQANEYVLEYAAELEKKIDNLQPITKIESEERYKDISNEILSLTLTGDDFGTMVRMHVSNYSELEKYEADFERLRNTYRITCTNCGGDGILSCSYCYGRGKNSVKWYEYGDWGEVSYSSYDCNYCNASGKKSCNVCSGRGGYYHYHP